MGNNIITITTTTAATATVVIIFIRIVIIITTTVITIRSITIEINVLITLGVFFVIKGKFTKLFKLFIKVVVGRLITLISDGVTENIGNFYFKIINLYTLIKFIFIKEGSKFIFEIELLYILNYFKILYLTTNFYSKVNAIIFSI